MRKFLLWLLMALGLIKRPPKVVTPPPPKPDGLLPGVKRPAPTFHGFRLTDGNTVAESQKTLLDFRPTWRGGCGSETMFGVEDNGTGPYEYKVTILTSSGIAADQVFDAKRNPIAGRWTPDPILYWFPLWMKRQPPYPYAAVSPACATETPPAPPQVTAPANTAERVIDVWIRNMDSQQSHWSVVTVVRQHACN